MGILYPMPEMVTRSEPMPDLDVAREQVQGTLSASWREYRAALKALRGIVATDGTTNGEVVVPNGSTNS